MFALALVGVVLASACGTDRCRETRALATPTSNNTRVPDAPLVAPGPPEPVCYLTPSAAEKLAVAWLARAAGTAGLPDGFTVDECRSHCIRDNRVDELCGSWQCRVLYGPPNSFESDSFYVFLIGCGRTIFTERPYTACFDRPHGCRFTVDSERARSIAEEYTGDPDSLSTANLMWDPEHAEFHWRISSSRPTLSALRVSAHVERVWIEPVERVPLRMLWELVMDMQNRAPPRAPYE